MDWTIYWDKEEIWEDLWKKILEIVHSYRLKNLNENHKNFPWLDLFEEKDWIWIQVSVDASSDKIRDTLNKIKTNKDIEPYKKTFDQLKTIKFLFIVSKYDPKNKFECDPKYSFNKTKDIYTFNSIIKDLESKSIEELEIISEFLNKEFENSIEPYIKTCLQKDDYKLLKEIISKDPKIFADKAFEWVLKEYENTFIPNDTENSISIEIEWFTDVLLYTINFIERLEKGWKSITKSEKKWFYEKLINNNSVGWHFFHNLKNHTLFNELKEIIDKIFKKKGAEISTKSKILEYLFLCFKHNPKEILLILLEITKSQDEDEYILRRISIFLSDTEVKTDNIQLLIEIIKSLLEKKYFIVNDFTMKIIQKNIKKFNIYQQREILDLFEYNAEKAINPDTTESKTYFAFRWGHYVEEIASGYIKSLWKILKKNHKYVFDKVDSVLENYKDSYDDSKIYEVRSWFKYISPWKFDEITDFDWQLSRERNPIQKIYFGIWKNLSEIEKSNKVKFIEISNYIIDNLNFSIYFEMIAKIISKNADKYPTLVKKLIEKEGLLSIVDYRSKKWGLDIFNKYLKNNPKYSNKFERNITTLIDDEYRKAYLLKMIPEEQLSIPSKEYISAFETKYAYVIDYTDRPRISVMTSYWKEDDNKLILTNWMNIKQVQDAFEPLLSEKSGSMHFWDYSWKVETFFSENPKLAFETYKYLCNKNIVLASLVTDWYIKYITNNHPKASIEFYKEVIDLFWIIDVNDNHSNLSIARLLEKIEYLRSEFTKEIYSLDAGIFNELRKVLIGLSNNPDPEDDSNDSREQRAWDWMTLWLNSVRWVWSTLLCIFLHYFPKDKEFEDKIFELSYDKLNWIKAYLISNLKYLVTTNYSLVLKILENFKYNRNAKIDFIIVRELFFHFWIKKAWENKDLFKEILKSDNDEVQESLWQLFFWLLWHWDDYDDIFEDVLKQPAAYHIDFLEWIAMWVEDLIPKVEEKDLDNALSYAVRLLSINWLPQENMEKVITRLSYLFDQNLIVEYMPKILGKGIFKLFSEKSSNPWTFHSINRYLIRNIQEWKNINESLEVIKQEIDNTEDIIKDPISAWDIWKILKIAYDDFDWINNEIAYSISEKWLKYGNQEFYEIFNKYYK